MVAIAERYDDVFFTVGTHPHEAAGEDAEDFDAMRASPRIPNASASARRGSTITTTARRAMSLSASSAPRSRSPANSSLPLVIHTRDADADMAAILTEEMGQGRFAPLLHCFTASRELAETALGLGLSFRFPAS